VRALGAETVIDYTAEDLATALRARYPGGADKALNGVAGEAANQAVMTLRAGGRIVDLTGTASVARPDVQVNTTYVVQADANRLARIARMIDAGDLKVEIQEVIPFERAPDALERVLARHVRGKIVLKIA
jgi:NADPH:quinone reductase-like Zn-dependent oxidoreductase